MSAKKKGRLLAEETWRKRAAEYAEELTKFMEKIKTYTQRLFF